MIDPRTHQPEKESAAITLAKAHLDSELEHYVILGLKPEICQEENGPIKSYSLQEYFAVSSKEVLEKLYELFLARIPQYISQHEHTHLD